MFKGLKAAVAAFLKGEPLLVIALVNGAADLAVVLGFDNPDLEAKLVTGLTLASVFVARLLVTPVADPKLPAGVRAERY